jgi:hypothetical protein
MRGRGRSGESEGGNAGWWNALEEVNALFLSVLHLLLSL